MFTKHLRYKALDWVRGCTNPACRQICVQRCCVNIFLFYTLFCVKYKYIYQEICVPQYHRPILTVLNFSPTAVLLCQSCLHSLKGCSNSSCVGYGEHKQKCALVSLVRVHWLVFWGPIATNLYLLWLNQDFYTFLFIFIFS